MDRTFEAIEITIFPSRNDFESFVVIVSAGLTFSPYKCLLSFGLWPKSGCPFDIVPLDPVIQ
jgi:hypothetical protein